MKCPTCKGPLPEALKSSGPPTERWPHFPFCSERCQMVDLGRWFAGEYVVPGPPVHPDELPRGDSRETEGQGSA